MPLTPKLTMHDLHNTDMKKLIRILHTNPSEPISSLPSRLRSTPLHLTSPLTPTGTVKPGRLCLTHSTLNAHLITSIWSWLHYELTSGIGPFLHPVILHGGLTSTQERKARQLEPVAEMWDAHFDIADSTPIERDPIRAQIWLDGEKKWVSKWRYEATQCPACMLARIGSDNDVLFALFAGMVGRFPERKSGESGKAVSSKRLRFMRYWVKAGAVDGDKVVEEAWEFGREMKRVRRAWREFVKGGREKGRGFYGKGGGCGKDVGGKDGCGCERDDWDEYLDPKVGPLPRPSGMEQRTRSDEVMGRDMSDPYAFRTYEEYMRRRDPEFEHEKHHIDPFADPTTPITPHSEYQSHPQHDQNPFSPPTSPTSPSPSLHGPYPNPEYHAHAEIVSPSHPSIHSHSGKMSTASSDTYEIDSYYYGSRGSNLRVDLSAEKKGNDNEARRRVSKQTQLPRHQHPASVKDSSDAEDGCKVSVGALVASLREEGKCGGSGRGVSVDTRWTDLY